MKLRYFIPVAFTMMSLISVAQQPQQYSNYHKQSVATKGRAPFRNELFSYELRKMAEQGDVESNKYILPVELIAGKTLRSVVEIPYLWLDRELFLKVEGCPEFKLNINGKEVGYATDSRAEIEFNISKWVTDGDNLIEIEPISGGVGEAMESAIPNHGAVKALLYSQPKLRIEDYTIKTEPDTTGKHSILKLDCMVANSYPGEETITVGYDIYTPYGKLLNYDMRDIEISANSRDTINFEFIIENSVNLKWSTTKPQLYKVVAFVRRDGRYTEHIAFKLGITEVSHVDNKIIRDGAEVNLKVVKYNAASDKTHSLSQIKLLKTKGFNTVLVDYPQPKWFYELCDEVGMNIIDQPNINSNGSIGKEQNGNLSNDPRLVNYFTERVEAMYKRSKDHPSIIGWSLGGNIGNGYNMYKSYQLLKSLDSSRVVIFNGAEGEWNSDMIIEYSDAKEVMLR